MHRRGAPASPFGPAPLCGPALRPMPAPHMRRPAHARPDRVRRVSVRRLYASVFGRPPLLCFCANFMFRRYFGSAWSRGGGGGGGGVSAGRDRWSGVWPRLRLTPFIDFLRKFGIFLMPGGAAGGGRRRRARGGRVVAEVVMMRAAREVGVRVGWGGGWGDQGRRRSHRWREP